MRAFEIITEAVGLKGGTPGEIYTDANGVEYKFQNWNWEFPPGIEQQYASMQDMEAAALEQAGGDKNKILWVNRPQNRSKSFAYARFESDDGREILIGKFYDRKSPNNTIYDADAKAIAGLTAGGKNKKSSAAVKSDAKLKPFDVGIGDARSRSASSVIKTVSSHKDGEMLVAGLNSAISGKPIVFPGGAALAPAIQDDFGEVFAPIAMISGHPQVSGHMSQAIADVFKGADISNATISYPVSLVNGLVDSYIQKDGIELAVSSKGKQGAKGSIGNIHKAKEDSANSSTGRAYIKKFAEAARILDVCKEHQRFAPLVLGVELKLISQNEADTIRELLSNPRDPKQQLAGDQKNPEAVIKSVTPEDIVKVPKNLQRIFTMGGYKSGSFVGFICIARVAKLVADKVNSDPTIDFGEAIRSFLNSSAMVQIKCAVSSTGNDATVKTINVVYPPNFKDKAKMESNWYSGRQIKGGFSFSLPTT
jgi:hypothetical protein